MSHEFLNNELDEATKLLISKVESMEEELNKNKKELSAKDKEIQQLKNELDYLKGIISNRNKKIFGTSSEQIDTNQLSFFNEAEKHSDSKLEEPTLEEITYKELRKATILVRKII